MTAERLTKHQYYDLLVQTSASGGFPSIERRVCRYRGNDGRRCAVGLIIPDDEYKQEWEGLGLEAGVDSDTEEELYCCVSNHLPVGLSLDNLADVQNAHDTQAFEPEWNHGKFVKKLNGMECFRGFGATPSALASA
jgi:hypothetical protein